MARVKRGTKRRARRKKYLKRTKGFFLTKSKLYQSAQEAANRADRYAKRDRRVKKREYRKLWIQRIGAAARNNGITYGQLIHGLKAAGVSLDRKILADIAVKDAAAFTSLVASAKAAAPPHGHKSPRPHAQAKEADAGQSQRRSRRPPNASLRLKAVMIFTRVHHVSHAQEFSS